MSDLSLYSNFIDPIILGLISQDNFSFLDSLVLYDDDYINSFLIDLFPRQGEIFLSERRFLDRMIKPETNAYVKREYSEYHGDKEISNSKEYDSLEVKLLNQNYLSSNPLPIDIRIKGVNFDIPLYEEKSEKIRIPFICNKRLKNKDADSDENTYQILDLRMSYIGNINLLDSPSVLSKKNEKGFLGQIFDSLTNYNSFCFYKKIHFFLFTNSNKETSILTSCLTFEKTLTVPFLNKIRELKNERKRNYQGGEQDIVLRSRRGYNYREIARDSIYVENTSAHLTSIEPFKDFDQRINEFYRLNKDLEKEAKTKKAKSEFADLYAELPYLITKQDSDAWIYTHRLSEKLWEYEIDFSDLVNEYL